ncbi:transmembrane protein 272 [Exaiptasia diaphana]|uniref:Uncharacterized protein n=1 Tax=Exaiptasia diaphana TaxID=2652724 RepID=A0A913YAS4_EXADI|nr:transmembrane protein 272 [Exaiptasia diaphana]
MLNGLLIVLGAKYKDDCPVEKYIPIYLIVGGSFGIFRNFCSLCKRGKQHGSSNGEEESKHNPVEAIVDCFLLAWFIAGNVWIYSNYKPSWIPGEKNYCNKTLYLFAFWLTNTTYIMIGVTCVCLCCAGICAAFAS